MRKIYTDLTQLIGHTPLLEVKKIEEAERLKARLLVKLESFNPGGSIKDRAALAMIDSAVASGQLAPGGTIVEPTSGNTGIGLAWIGVSRGFEVILTMPESMSVERRSILQALGATLILTPAQSGMNGAIAEAERLVREIPGAVMMRQFDNPANPEIHSLTTAREIWDDTDGRVGIVVAGVGTGGTLTGIARALKQMNDAVEAVGVEPSESPVLEGGKAGPHGIHGIGAGFVPGNYDAGVVDRVIAVDTVSAYAGARMLAAKEGVFAGISSGAAFYAAMELARKDENVGKTIVAVLPDTGDRYLSTPLYAPKE